MSSPSGYEEQEKRKSAEAAKKANKAAAARGTASKVEAPPEEAKLGPNGEVPEGLTDEGAANLATRTDKPEVVKKLAGRGDEKGGEGARDGHGHDGGGEDGTDDTQTREAARVTEPVRPGKRGARKGPQRKGEREGKKKAAPTPMGDGQGAREKNGKGAEVKKRADGEKGGKKAADQGGADEGEAVKGCPAIQGTRADDAGAPGGCGGFDIDFIARENAIHEQWAGLPAGRDSVVREYSAQDVKDAGTAGPTLTLEQRQELLNKALGGGVASGVAQFGLGLAVKTAFNQGSKFIATKGFARALPAAGFVLSVADMLMFFAERKHEGMGDRLGKVGALFSSSASLTDKADALRGIKTLLDLLSMVFGVIAGFCGLLSLSVVCAPVCGPLALGFGIVGSILSLLSTAVAGAIAYIEYQEALTMEGSPADVLKKISEFEAHVATTTDGVLCMPGKVKDVTEKTRDLQEKLVGQTTPQARDVPKHPPAEVKPEKAEGPKGKPQSLIIIPDQEKVGAGGGIIKPPPPDGFKLSQGGLYVPKSPQGFENTGSGLLVPTAPEGFETTAGGLLVPSVTTKSTPAPTRGALGNVADVISQGYLRGKSPSVRGAVQSLGDGNGTNVGPVVLSDKVPIESIAQGEMATTRPDVTYTPDNSGGKLTRRASLKPLPDPPYNLSSTVARLRKVADLARQEEGLAEALRVGKEGERKLDAELAPGGAAELITKTYQEYSKSIEEQDAEVKERDAKVRTSEELLEKERAKDQETRTRSGEVLNNEAARKAGELTSDPVLCMVARGGATAAKAVGGAINWVASEVFGADEDVIDTKAIENVRKLFSEAPKAKSGRAQLEGQSGQIGRSADGTAPRVAENRARVAETQAREAEARGKVTAFQAAGKQATDTIRGERGAISKGNAAIEAQREKVRRERAEEFSAYLSEMGALSTWAVQHRSVRDANNALLDDMGQPPTVAELAPEARAMVEATRKAVAAARTGVQQARGRMEDTASRTGTGLRRAAMQMGTTPESVEPVCARLLAEAGRFHERLLEPQLKTLESMDGMLGSVAAERLPGVIDAAQKTAKATEVSVRDAVAAFQRLANRTAEETVTRIQEEVRKKRDSMRAAAQY